MSIVFLPTQYSLALTIELANDILAKNLHAKMLADGDKKGLIKSLEEDTVYVITSKPTSFGYWCWGYINRARKKVYVESYLENFGGTKKNLRKWVDSLPTQGTLFDV